LELYLLLILLFVLLILSAFFSASETALTAFSRSKLSHVEEEKPKKALRLKAWLKKPNEILSAILLGNNIVNILASSIATMMAISILGNNSKAIAIATGCTTVFLLIFGEITPKVVAKAYSTSISLAVIHTIYTMSKLFFPLTWLLMLISKMVARIFGVKIGEVNFLITEEEIKSVVNIGEEEGVIEKEEKKMIHSIFEFNDTTVKEVMVHRTSIFSLDGLKTIEESLDLITENSFSRIPVYEDKIDNIIGILYQKDIFKIIKEHKMETQIKDCVREVFFVPESKSLFEMLEDFKLKRVHIAVVIDEFGGTSGLVTIEDLLEEIVGDINDEFDISNNEDIKEISNNKFVVNALLDIPEINEKLNIALPVDDNYESLGGFIYAALGRVPLEKDVIMYEDTIEIRVLKMKTRRVEKVLITIKTI